MERHLIVISVDAMVQDDLALPGKLPNMGRLLREGSVVRAVESIYPTLTHPIHTALMTGCAAALGLTLADADGVCMTALLP